MNDTFVVNLNCQERLPPQLGSRGRFTITPRARSMDLRKSTWPPQYRLPPPPGIITMSLSIRLTDRSSGAFQRKICCSSVESIGPRYGPTKPGQSLCQDRLGISRWKNWISFGKSTHIRSRVSGMQPWRSRSASDVVKDLPLRWRTPSEMCSSDSCQCQASKLLFTMLPPRQIER